MQGANLGKPLTDALDAMAKETKSSAAALLDVASRPSHAVAALALSSERGESRRDRIRAAGDALEGKNDALWSDVLKESGVKNKFVRGAGGLVLDVALDPLNLVTLGATAPAKIAAASKKAAVLKAGANDVAAGKLSKADLERRAHTAAKEVYDAAPAHERRKGVRVHVRGVKTDGSKKVRIVASANRRGGKQLSSRPIGTRLHHGLADVAASGKGLTTKKMRERGVVVAKSVRHDHKPGNVHELDFDLSRSATRQYRASREAGDRYALDRAKHVDSLVRKAKLTPADEFEIIKAVEAADFAGLPKVSREIAELYQREAKKAGADLVDRGLLQVADVRGKKPRLAGFANVKEWQLALKEWDARPAGYFHRGRNPLIEIEDAARPPRVAGGENAAGAALKGRKVRGRLADADPEYLATRDLRVAASLGNFLKDHGRNAASQDLRDRVAALGKTLDKDMLDELADAKALDADRIFIRAPKGFRQIIDEQTGVIDLPKAYAALARGDEVVLIPRVEHDLVRELRDRGRAMSEDQRNMGMAAFDSVQGGLKTLQTVVNPGYHVTNLIGDTLNAKQSGATGYDLYRGARLKRLERELDLMSERALDELPPKIAARAARTDTYGDDVISDLDIVKRAMKHGVVKTGFAGGELPALARGESIAPSKNPLKRGGEAAFGTIQNYSERREDMIRLGSWYSAKKRGLTDDEAAEWVNTHHFDYGDLTDFERQFMRRVFPFYTFMARNMRLQVGSFVRSPRVAAHYELVQDEAAVAAGLEQDWDEGLDRARQQALPIALPGGTALDSIFGADGNVQLSLNPKAPLMDLNLLSTNGGELKEQLVSRMTVMFKVPIEQGLELNTFTGEKYNQPRIPAPSYVAHDNVREALNRIFAGPPFKVKNAIRKINEPKSGKMVYGWSWRIDEVMRQVPAINLANNVLTPGRGKTDVDRRGAVAGYMLGPRVAGDVPEQIEVRQLQEEKAELEAEAETLRQYGPKLKSGQERKYKLRKVNKEISALERRLYKLNKKLGHAQPSGTPPKKPHVKKIDMGGGMGSDMGGSGMGG